LNRLVDAAAFYCHWFEIEMCPGDAILFKSPDSNPAILERASEQ
jgi:hypothetical protein